MLTVFEEVRLHRVRDQAAAARLGCWLCVGVAIAAGLVANLGGPRELEIVAEFEGFVAVLFWAGWRRSRSEQRKLEELR